MYAYRNGMVADALRKGGIPHKVIFGLNLPQLSAIAAEVKEAHSVEECDMIGRELWSTGDSREGRLLACWLMSTDTDVEGALELALSTRSREEDDILGFRYFKRHPQAAEVASALEARGETYRAEAIHRHL